MWMAREVISHQTQPELWTLSGGVVLTNPDQHLSDRFGDMQSVIVAVLTQWRHTGAFVVLQESRQGMRCVPYFDGHVSNHGQGMGPGLAMSSYEELQYDLGLALQSVFQYWDRDEAVANGIIRSRDASA
jgi:hypothetical protein